MPLATKRMALLRFGRSATRASLDALPAAILVVRVRGAQPPACVAGLAVDPPLADFGVH